MLINEMFVFLLTNYSYRSLLSSLILLSLHLNDPENVDFACEIPISLLTRTCTIVSFCRILLLNDPT